MQKMGPQFLPMGGEDNHESFSGIETAAPRLSRRIHAYIGGNLLFGALLISLVALGDSGKTPPTFYLLLLFLLCSTPLLLAGKYNGKYSILVVFAPMFFMFYGFADLVSYLPGFTSLSASRSAEFITEGEIAIILGGACLITGYTFIVSILSKSSSSYLSRDWSLATVTIFGVGLWLIGLWATWTWQLSYSDTRVRTVQDSLLTTTLTLLRMLQPVGSALLAYSFLKSRRLPLLCLVILCMVVELPFGLMVDSKELAIRTAIIFVFSKWLFDGYVPYRWMTIAAIVIVAAFPIFQSYRYEVLQTRSNTREKAVQNFSKSLETALDSKASGKENELTKGIRGLSGRINLKGNMERIVRETGSVVPFQNGYTISLVAYALIPRFILPDKPDSSVGQLFNRQFKISLDPDTYISATHMGELFWNYGWPGLIVGMFIIGCIMGGLSCIASMDNHKSVTRLLLLVTTVYLLCLRFEGGIALQYTLWIRSLILIFILHFFFRRRSTATR